MSDTGQGWGRARASGAEKLLLFSTSSASGHPSGEWTWKITVLTRELLLQGSEQGVQVLSRFSLQDQSLSPGRAQGFVTLLAE